jgi:hypothetical protein
MGKPGMVVGGKPNEAACVEQNGQCADCITLSDDDPEPASSSPTAALTNLTPDVEQTSIHAMSAPRATDKAWEIDGASAAIKIARHAAQAAHRRVRVFINM